MAIKSFSLTTLKSLIRKAFLWLTATRRRKILASTLAILITLTSIRFLFFRPKEVSADSLLKFDEGYGTTVNDAAGSASGTITGAAWKTDDLCRQKMCLYFDGSDWISFGDEASFDFAAATDFTIEFWFRHAPATTAEVIIQKYEGTGGDGGYRIQMESDGDISFGVDDTNGGFADDNIVSTAASYDDNRWHHVAAVKDATSAIYLYIDGVQVASDSTIGSTGSLANDDTFYIGDSNGADGGDEFIGFLDEVKIYTSSARTQAEINSDVLGVTSSRGVSAAFGSRDFAFLSDGLVGYWNMDEASWGTPDCSTDVAFDSSGNGKNGDACPNSTGPAGGNAGKFGNGVLLDGFNDYINVADDPIFDITGAMTVSAWIKVTNLPGSNESDGVVAKGTAGETSAVNHTFFLFVENGQFGSGNAVNFMFEDSAGNNYAARYQTTLTTNRWYHLSGVYDTANAKVVLYIDGVEVASMTGVTATPNIQAQPVTIGYNGWDHYLDGTIDDVHIYNRSFSPAEIRRLADWAPGPVGYWNLDEGTGISTVNDRSGNDYTSTMNGSMTESDWVTGKFGHALNFDGSDDEISIADGADYSTDTFTISAWVYIDSDNETEQTIFDNRDANDDGFVLEIAASGANDVACRYNTTDASDGSLSTDTWYHVACTSDGSNIRIYIDGQPFSPVAITGSIAETTNAAIGGRNYTTGTNFPGSIDDVRFYNYDRTTSQIIEDMNAGHPAPGSPIGSPIAYWKFDEQQGQTSNDSGTANVDLTLGTTSGSESTDPTWKLPTDCKINGCLDFDGTGDRVQGNSSSLELTGDLSISFWFKVDTIADQETFIYQGETGSELEADNELYFIRWDTTSGNDIEYGHENGAGVDNYNVFDTNLSTATWYHLVLVRDVTANTVKLYINGLQSGSTYSYSNDPTGGGSGEFSIGNANDTGASDNPYDGIIEEVKIYNFALTADQVKVDATAGSSAAFGGVLGTHDNEGFGGNPPVGWWKMDENTGSSVFDYSENDTTITIANGTAFTPAKIGAGLLFSDDTDDDADAPSTSILHITGDLSVSFWMNSSVIEDGDVIVTVRGGGETEPDNEIFYLEWDTTSGNDILYQHEYGAGLDSQNIFDTNLSANTWYHVAIARDVTANTVKMYIDGVQTGSTYTYTNDPTCASCASNLKIALKSTSSTNNRFQGIIDELKIYNYTRTPAQIAYDFNRGGPIGYWKFDECQGATAYDSSGKGNDGTIFPQSLGNTTVGTCGSGTGTEMWNDGTTGKRNASLGLDGSDDYVDFGNGDSLDLAGNFTISGWIYRNSDSGGFERIIAKTNKDAAGTNDWSWMMQIDTGDKLEVGCVRATDNSASQLDSATTISTGSWYHIVGIKNNTEYEIYINGRKDANGLTSGLFGDCKDLNMNTYLGRLGDAGTWYYGFNGLMDEFKVFNYVLTADQIKRDFLGGAQRFGPSEGSP